MVGLQSRLPAGRWPRARRGPSGSSDTAAAGSTTRRTGGWDAEHVEGRFGVERPVGGRSKLGGFYLGGRWVALVDDSYNANPDSVQAAIEVLTALPAPRLLVLGDMGELGRNSAGMHREVGAYARGAGIERLYALGELSRETVTAFGAGAAHFRTAEDLVSSLQPLLGPQTTPVIQKQD